MRTLISCDLNFASCIFVHSVIFLASELDKARLQIGDATAGWPGRRRVPPYSKPQILKSRACVRLIFSGDAFAFLVALGPGRIANFQKKVISAITKPVRHLPAAAPALVLWLMALAACTMPGPAWAKPLQAQSVSPPTNGAAPRSGGSDAWVLLWKFAIGRPTAGGQSWPAATDRQAAALLQDRLAPYDTDFVIATIADPIESHAQGEFDRSLAAIQAATGAAGYSLSRFELPWKTPSDQQAHPGDAGLSQDATFRPGVILFFNSSARPNQLLLVFLVGETPTAGIHKAAFYNALEQADDLCSHTANCRRRNNGPLLILGPTFSGSLPSMRAALAAYLKSKPGKVKIISGSATATGSMDLPKSVSFETTVHDDLQSFAAVRHYLSNRCHASDKEIGILYEEGTGYGSSLREEFRAYRGLTFIPFPFGVSELHQPGQSSESSAKSTSLTEDNRLHPVLTPENAGHDILPVFSTLKQAKADTILSSALDAIRQDNLKYVGILATDVRDTVFLAQQIRNHVPNVLVFVLDNDSLYLNSEVVHDLGGMLISSTYPLFPISQLFTGTDVRFIFSSQQEEGTYNALLGLLDHDSTMLDYRAPEVREGAALGHAAVSNRPPVWLTVVGSDQFWPLGVTLADNRGVHDGKPPAPAPEGRALNDSLRPRGLKLLLLITGLFCVCAVGIRLFAWLGFRLPVLSALNQVNAPLRHAQNFYMLGLFLILAILFTAACLAFALPIYEFPGYFPHSRRTLTCVAAMLLVLALLFLAIAWQGYLAVRQFDNQSRPSEYLAASFVFLMPATWMALLLWYGWTQITTTKVADVLWLAPAAALRFTNVDSGVSAFRPLFLIGLAGLSVAYGALRRLQLGEQLFPDKNGNCGFLGLSSRSFRGLQTQEEDIATLISGLSLNGGSRFPFSLSLIVATILLAWWIFGPSLNARSIGAWFTFSLEGPPFNWLFVTAFLAVYLEIAHSGLRCALCWYRFKRLLHRLSQSPLVEDLAGVGKEADDDRNPTPRLRFSMPRATFTSLYCSIEAADRIARCGSVDQKIRDQAKSLKVTFDHAILLGASGAQHLIAEMARVAAPVCESLEPFSPMRLAQASAGGAEEAARCCRRFLATRVLHYCWIMMTELRNWLVYTAGGLFLMLMAVSSYPFINDDTILRFSWVALLAGVCLALVLLVQINRDKVLSLLSGGTPGKIDWNWDFISRLLIYGVLPIVALLGIQFPATLSGLSHLIRAMLGANGGLK